MLELDDEHDSAAIDDSGTSEPVPEEVRLKYLLFFWLKSCSLIWVVAPKVDLKALDFELSHDLDAMSDVSSRDLSIRQVRIQMHPAYTQKEHGIF